MAILKKHCINEKKVAIKVVSDQSLNFVSRYPFHIVRTIELQIEKGLICLCIQCIVEAKKSIIFCFRMKT